VRHKKMMIEFLETRMLETKNLAALGINAGHHVLDGTVFSRRVHRLKNE
jgi:hypothetical protein